MGGVVLNLVGCLLAFFASTFLLGVSMKIPPPPPTSHDIQSVSSDIANCLVGDKITPGREFLSSTIIFTKARMVWMDEAPIRPTEDGRLNSEQLLGSWLQLLADDS